MRTFQKFQHQNHFKTKYYAITNIEDDKEREMEIMFILLIFSIEVDYYLRDVLHYVEICAYAFVLDYLDYRNA